MTKYTSAFLLTEEQKEAFTNFKNLTFERENSSYSLVVQPENPKYIYIEKNRSGISEEEKSRLSFFPEYLAGRETIITNTGLICFIADYGEDPQSITATIYDLVSRNNNISLNDIAFDIKTMFLTEEPENPGYDEYNTPLSYFKIAYSSPADKSIVNFPFDRHQKKYIKGSKLYLSFPVDRVEDTLYNDSGLFELPLGKEYLNALCYKYNQLFMFKAKERLYIKVFGVTNTNERIELTNSGLVKITTADNIAHVDLSNYLPEKYKYFEFKFTRDSVAELADCERFVEVVC